MHSQTVTTLTHESIDQFRTSLSARGRSSQTVKAYSTDLKILLKEIDTDEIPREELQEVGFNWLTANRKIVAPKTTQRRLTSLRAWCKWAKWDALFEDYTAPTPARAVAHPLPEGMDGVRRLIAAAKREDHKTLIALCGMLGLRVHEALSVKPSDFDLENMRLLVHGKGDKDRVVPVSPEAWDIIASQVTRAFVNDTVIVPIGDRPARRTITNLGVRAKLQRKISSHDLRATFATAVYDKTLDQRVVQELLGHSSGTTTEVYIGRSDKQMTSAVEGL